MSEQITIKSVHDDKKLELSWPEPHEPSVNRIKVRLVGSGLDVSTSVDLHPDHPLPKLFRGLADSWEGWEGEKHWRTLEGEFELTASTDRTGHVILRVELRPGHYVCDWRLETAMELEDGQLETLTRDMARFFAGASAERVSGSRGNRLN
jgi:hypothetical protein